jgi:predicted hydrocarbon binding protein
MGLAWIFKKLLWGNAFAAERGRIRLFGSMDWTLFPSRALALNLQTIGEKLGEEFIYKLGYEAGKDAAKEMVKYMGLKPRGGWVTQKAVIAMLEFIGFGKPEFLLVKIKRGGHHHIIVHVRDNPVMEHGARMFGTKSMACKWFMGVYAAHGEMELGVKHVKLKENRCIRLGAPYCEWETKW